MLQVKLMHISWCTDIGYFLFLWYDQIEVKKHLKVLQGFFSRLLKRSHFDCLLTIIAEICAIKRRVPKIAHDVFCSSEIQYLVGWKCSLKRELIHRNTRSSKWSRKAHEIELDSGPPFSKRAMQITSSDWIELIFWVTFPSASKMDPLLRAVLNAGEGS